VAGHRSQRHVDKPPSSRLITRQGKSGPGTIRIGETALKLAYVIFQMIYWNPRRRTSRAGDFRGRGNPPMGNREVNSRAYRGPIHTSPAREQQKKVGFTSGGERNRVHLANTAGRKAGNVILLDEPTMTWS